MRLKETVQVVVDHLVTLPSDRLMVNLSLAADLLYQENKEEIENRFKFELAEELRKACVRERNTMFKL